MTDPSLRHSLLDAQQQLAAWLDADEARAEAEWLLCHALHCERSHLYTWPDKTLDSAQRQHFEQLLARRLRGEPMAYIKGEKEFWSRRFEVGSGCLIPRPETELLVEFALAHCDRDHALSLLDAGTGSGAIAVTLACECPHWRISASDIDEAALRLARRNADAHGADIRFIRSDWFSAIDARFDVIISNPPYIASGDPHLEQGDLRFEPRQALAAGGDGLDALRVLCSQAPEHLNAGGWLLLEHGHDQMQAVRALLQANGFDNIQQLHDHAGVPRLSAGQRVQQR